MTDLISREAARDVINTWGRHEGEDVRMNLLHNDLNAVPAVEAVPVDWLDDRANDITRAPLYRRYAQMILDEWQQEQEAR